jgi:hypothetical protein
MTTEKIQAQIEEDDAIAIKIINIILDHDLYNADAKRILNRAKAMLEYTKD